jgi:hypothetical protein
MLFSLCLTSKGSFFCHNLGSGTKELPNRIGRVEFVLVPSNQNIWYLAFTASPMMPKALNRDANNLRRGACIAMYLFPDTFTGFVSIR